MLSRRCSSGLVLSVVIILLALECAECDQGILGTESQKDVLLERDAKSLLGRKMLQELVGKTVHMPGLEKPLPEAQTENNHVQAQLQKSKRPDESKALLEAADEVANLMRKDYRGMARRKPPINNHVPKG